MPNGRKFGEIRAAATNTQLYGPDAERDVDESKWVEQGYYPIKTDVYASCGEQRRDLERQTWRERNKSTHFFIITKYLVRGSFPVINPLSGRRYFPPR
jgi:hypothetical protein